MERIFDARKYRKPYGVGEPSKITPRDAGEHKDGRISGLNGVPRAITLPKQPQQANVWTAGGSASQHVIINSPAQVDAQKPLNRPVMPNIQRGVDLSSTGVTHSVHITEKANPRTVKGTKLNIRANITVGENPNAASGDGYSEVHSGPPASEKLTMQEKLRQIQAEKLKEIRLRTRCQGNDYTTSPRDLHLARASLRWGSELSNPWPPSGDTRKLADHQFVDQEQRKHSTPGHSLNTSQPTPKATQNASTEFHTLEAQCGILSHTLAHEGDWSFKQAETPKPSNEDNFEVHKTSADRGSVRDHAETEFTGHASQWSEDSREALQDQQMRYKEIADTQNAPLIGFDGNIQPPPVDWSERPRFTNANPASMEGFRRWREDAIRLTRDERTRQPKSKPFPVEQVKDLSLHPDGLGFVTRFAAVGKDNADFYGYADVADATKYSQLPTEDLFDDWGKLDPFQPENERHKNDCTKDYIRTWNLNKEKHRQIQQARAESKAKAKEGKQAAPSEVNGNEPKINIYIRPAVRADIPQMASIYNYYVQRSCRTVELDPIAESDMRLRIAHSNSHQLPFLVAVLRNQKSMIPSDTNTEYQAWQNDGHPAKTIDPKKKMLGGIEKVVGWTSAQDFTAQRFVERLSIELELYVHPQFRQKGVARSLLDSIWRVLDRDYTAQACCPFTYPPGLSRLYEPGGGRDIHKAVLIIRKYKQPRVLDKKNNTVTGDLDQSVGKEKLNDREDDFDQWMRSWLERCGFQVEGVLTGLGAKNGRYIDLVYMGRETEWQPEDGQVPDPAPDLS